MLEMVLWRVKSETFFGGMVPDPQKGRACGARHPCPHTHGHGSIDPWIDLSYLKYGSPFVLFLETVLTKSCYVTMHWLKTDHTHDKR